MGVGVRYTIMSMRDTVWMVAYWDWNLLIRDSRDVTVGLGAAFQLRAHKRYQIVLSGRDVHILE